MAGKRHHFIPRFLQEGFATHGTEKTSFTWVYRKGAMPFKASIGNVGVEADFYAEGDDARADDLITEAEGRFGTLVKNLRTGPAGVVSDSEIPRFLAHLEVRTRHLRQSFLQATDFLVSSLIAFMADEDAFLGYVERHLRHDPSIILKELDELRVPEMLRPLFQQLLPTAIKPYLRLIADLLRRALPESLRLGAKSGQLRVLKETVAPEPRIHRYEGLTYSIVEPPHEPLILGDSAVFFRVEGARRYKPFLDKSDVLMDVFLPVSSTRALVGSAGGSSGLPDLRQASARCSLEYFIAPETSDANDLLQKEIGEDAALLTQAELEEIIEDVLRG